MKTPTIFSATRACLFGLVLLLAQSAAICQAESASASSGDATLPGIQGPSRIKLQGVAELALPAGYTFLEQNDAQAVLRQLGAGVNGKEIGLISPATRDWFAVLLFLDHGYMEPSPASLGLPAELLSDLQGAERAANDDRQSRNRPLVNVQDWDIAPRFDASSQQLEWAIKAETQGKTLINHYIARLGRSGVLKLCLVDQHRLASTTAKFRELGRQLSFVEGERVTDYTPGDKVAAGGLTYLVTGRIPAPVAGPGVEKPLVSSKTGKVLMRVFWFLFFAIIALTVGYVSGLVAARRHHYGPRKARPVVASSSAARHRSHSRSRSRERSVAVATPTKTSEQVTENARSKNGHAAQAHRQFDPWMYYQRLTRDLYYHG